MNYQQTLDYLYNSLPVFQRIGAAAYKANLDNTIKLDEHLGFPHHSFKTIHVAGTNGKGSVSQMIYEVLRMSGYKVGLYTSPHLRDFRERIIVDGQMITEQAVVDFVQHNKEFIEQVEPSFFEVTVAMAFDYFRACEVDIAVVEVGMGGRLDSTNIISPLLSVITNIDYDHTQFLGSTLDQIAAEKAGIIKPYTPVVVGESRAETAPVFIQKARQEQTTVLFADQRYRCSNRVGGRYTIDSLLDGFVFEVELGMEGDYQRMNVCTAIAALDLLSEYLDITPESVKSGLASAVVMGRWYKLGESPLVVCDTGHNKVGIKCVVEQIAQQNYQKLIMVIGMVSDKDIEAVLAMLPQQAYYIFTQASIPRAMDAMELSVKAQEYSLHGEVVGDVAGALSRARELAGEQDMIFVGGSTFVVAEVV